MQPSSSELELNPCLWHRAYCSRCGLVNLALADRADSRRGRCPLCQASCVIAFKGAGRTCHPVPYVEPVIIRLRPCFFGIVSRSLHFGTCQ